MIDALRDGIALADSHGVLMITNRQLEEMFGYQDGELYGLPVEQLIPAHLQLAHRRHRAGYAQAPAPRPMGTGARLVGLRKDGSTFPAEISLSPVQTATGRLTLTVVRDVTGRRARADLAAATTSAQEAWPGPPRPRHQLPVPPRPQPAECRRPPVRSRLRVPHRAARHPR